MKLTQKYSAGLAIIYNKNVLLGHTTGRKGSHSYGISKGGIHEGESKRDAALRETFEEFGINVPVNLIQPHEFNFSVISKRYGYNKTVYYYIVEINDLKQIGLSGYDVPRSQLQLEEVDIAKFVDYKHAMQLVMKSQIPLITNLLSKGLI